DDCLPAPEHSGAVLGMKRGLPARAGGVADSNAGPLVPALVEKLDSPVGERGTREHRKRIEEPVGFTLHRRPYCTGEQIYGSSREVVHWGPRLLPCEAGSDLRARSRFEPDGEFSPKRALLGCLAPLSPRVRA